MGTFNVHIELLSIDDRPSLEVEALVDTGATHTLLPVSMMKELGIEPIERVAFQLAGERTVEYPIGEVRLRMDGRERTVVAVFGPEGAAPLLGATTLELFNLGVDPVRRRLISVPGLLKRSLTSRSSKLSY